MYQNLVRTVDNATPESVHLCDFPKAHEEMIDTALERKMDEVLKIVVLGRAARNTANIKNRQPLGRMYVKSEVLPVFYQTIILDELNVKEVEFVSDVQDFISYTFKPQLKTVGPKYGKQLGNIKTALLELDGNKAMDRINEQGFLSFEFDGQSVELTKDDLLIDMTQKQGFISETDNTVIVVLDTRLTPELIEEGFIREIISKVQTMRKEAGFEVTDHITVYIQDNESISSVLRQNEIFIKNEVLAEQIRYEQMEGYKKEWNINGEKVILGVKKFV